MKTVTLTLTCEQVRKIESALAIHAAELSYHGARAASAAEYRALAFEVDELCQQGLNSGNPAHWEAALQDILQAVRDRQ